MSFGLFSVDYRKIELYLVDRDFVLSSIVLSDSCEETLGEVKPGEPENNRNTIIYPVFEHFGPMNQVLVVAYEGF